MSIVDDITRSLPEFRQHANDLMLDEAEVTRGDGSSTLDPETGRLTPSEPPEIYAGPCRLRQPTAQESEILFGDAQIVTTRFVACLPHDAPLLRVGDAVKVRHAASSTELHLRVAGTSFSTFTIYKGYPVELNEVAP